MNAVPIDNVDESIIIYQDDDDEDVDDTTGTDDDDTDDDDTDDEDVDPNKEDPDSEQDTLATSNVVYIEQKDVTYGTYRITEPGTYILTTDITFDFNAATDEEKSDESWSPNNYDTDNIAWYDVSKPIFIA